MEWTGFTEHSAVRERHLPLLSGAIGVSGAEQRAADHLNKLAEDGSAGLLVAVVEVGPQVLDELVQVRLLLGIVFAAIYQFSTLNINKIKK